VNFRVYEHHEASKYLAPECIDSVERVLTTLKVSKEHSTAPIIRKRLLDDLYSAGWSEEARLDPSSSITITSVRRSVGLCFQTGNMARIYADMLKLQLLFSRSKIVAAVFILFSKATASKLGENLANFDRLTKELQIFEEVINVPMVVFGLEVVES
jgi:hypothetical protein